MRTVDITKCGVEVKNEPMLNRNTVVIYSDLYSFN